jgi:hypothetical protein
MEMNHMEFGNYQEPGSMKPKMQDFDLRGRYVYHEDEATEGEHAVGKATESPAKNVPQGADGGQRPAGSDIAKKVSAKTVQTPAVGREPKGIEPQGHQAATGNEQTAANNDRSKVPKRVLFSVCTGWWEARKGCSKEEIVAELRKLGDLVRRQRDLSQSKREEGGFRDFSG